MNLREFLAEREKELTERIGELHARVAPLEVDLALYQEAKAVVNRPIKPDNTEGVCNDALVEYQPSSPASTALRQFLDHHDEELTAQVNEVRGQLVPLEAELAEIRRAKAAIGANRGLPNQGLVDAMVGLGRVAIAFNDAGLRATQLLHAEREKYGGPLMLAAPSPYANLTMKELVVKALREHFHQGATTRQLLEFFRDAWGREIERTSLSPQLTRLFAAGIISQFGEGKEWFLIPEGANRVGHHAFRNRTSGEINWKLPNQARDDDVPAKLRESSRPDLD